jgi:hypothetical protein
MILTSSLKSGPGDKVPSPDSTGSTEVINYRDCHSSWLEYNAASSAWVSLYAPTKTDTYSDHTTYIQNIGKGDIYTDCDGIPRMARYVATGTTESVDSSTWTANWLDRDEMNKKSPFPRQRPQCQIGREDCDALLDSYYSSQGRNREVLLEQNGTPFIFDSAFPECTGRKCACVVRGQGIALIYWPPDLDSMAACAPRKSDGLRDRGPTPVSQLVLSTDAITITGTRTATLSDSIISSFVTSTGMKHETLLFLHLTIFSPYWKVYFHLSIAVHCVCKHLGRRGLPTG